MQINDEFGLIIALIVINWSALTIAIKCREKIDYSRNILWGLNNNKKPKKKNIINFMLEHDIKGFLFGLIAVYFVVGGTLITVGLYIFIEKLNIVIAFLYIIDGLVMMVSSIWMIFKSKSDIKKIKSYAKK